MSPPSDTSSNTEMGSIIYTPSSDSNPTLSNYGDTSEPDSWEILDRPVPVSRHLPTVFLRTLKGDHIDREWLVSLEKLRQHARFEEVAKAEQRKLPSLYNQSSFVVRRFDEEIEYIINYISEGDYPIFYTDSDGFNVPKYCKVRRCAAYYGVKGLVDWIDVEKYREVVVKVYDRAIHYGGFWGRERSADTVMSVSADGSVVFADVCRTIWKTDLLVEKRDENGVRIREA